MSQKSDKLGKFSIRDVVFLTALFLLGVVLTVGIYLFSKSGSRISIKVDGTLYGTYDLSESQQIPVEIDGRIANVIVIENGAAHMENADCPDHLCVKQGAISRNKQTIVCLPNKLVAEVIGGEKEAYDSISE